MVPYSGPKLSDLYTLSQSKLLENHTLHSGTYLYQYSPYTAVPPHLPRPGAFRFQDEDDYKGQIWLNNNASE